MSGTGRPAFVQIHPVTAVGGGAVNSDSSSPTTTSHTLTAVNAPGLFTPPSAATMMATGVGARPSAGAGAGAGTDASGVSTTPTESAMANSNINPAKADSAISSPTAAFLLGSLDPKHRHVFLQPPPALPDGSLQLAKQMLDVLAAQVGDQQQQRLRDANRAAKRRRPASHEDGPQKRKPEVLLKIRKLHVDGFDTAQVWQQARRIIAGTLSESSEMLRRLEASQKASGGREDVEEDEDDETDASEDIEAEAGGDPAVKRVRFDEGSFAMGSDAHDSASESSSGQPSDDGGDDLDEESEEDFDGFEDHEDEDEEKTVEQTGEEGERGSEDDNEDDDDDQPVGEYKQDPNGLNDGFFSLAEFNKETLWLEDQDARGDPNTDMASDDEELDWHTDPMAQPSGADKKASTKKKHKGHDHQMAMEGEDEDQDAADDHDEEDDEDGPTFGDMDLDAPEGASDDGHDGADIKNGGEGGGDPFGLDLTANDILYENFFAPPKRKAGAGKKKNRHFPDHDDEQPPQPDAADLEQAERDVRRDLFEDLSNRSDDSDDALSEASAGDPKSRRSAHERRQAKLGGEIRRLEAELVAKRAWTLSGEAAAVERPVNSLLEEELDFEHAGKPVRVVTEEVSVSIEDLIKRRILADEFDEVLRRRPDALASSGRRGLLATVDDFKGKQSLAELYEEDHVKKQASNGDANGVGGGAYVSAADEKSRREEGEIESMWRDVSGKLDALSSWHYRPRPAQPGLSVVADVATVAMEDAQPATAQGVGPGVESMLAPQEVYAPGVDTAEKGEMVAADGMPVARQEMSREDKARRRRRAKERIRKGGAQQQQQQQQQQANCGGGAGGNKKDKEDRKETMSQLKKGGVRVINRKGEVVDLNGKAPAAERRNATSGAYKL